MKGLVIWAKSTCRSAMGLYCKLGDAFGVPTKICMLYSKCENGYTDYRIRGGMQADEFSDVPKEVVGYGMEKGLKVIDDHPGWHHLFCMYHREKNYRDLLIEVRRRGDHAALMSESPCVMVSGAKGLAKKVYLKTLLSWRVRRAITAAEFFVNYSGDDPHPAMEIGWPEGKIIPFGYFMPPVPGSRFVQRTTNRPFEILASGSMTWHRGSDVLVKALAILQKRGVKFHATITQKGPLAEQIKKIARDAALPVDFPGFVPLEELCRLYETCSAYVGAGRHEPWGMRLNEALLCGAPLVVSRGMGGVQMIDQYGCGVAFENEDPVSLADSLERLATDSMLYDRVIKNVELAARACSPEQKARELARLIRERFPEWR